jgi:hypothetical protein
VKTPTTAFSLRANSVVREPEIQAWWQDKGIYQDMAANNPGVSPGRPAAQLLQQLGLRAAVLVWLLGDLLAAASSQQAAPQGVATWRRSDLERRARGTQLDRVAGRAGLKRHAAGAAPACCRTQGRAGAHPCNGARPRTCRSPTPCTTARPTPTATCTSATP